MSAVKNKTHSYSALIIFTLNNKVQNEQIRYIPLTTEGWGGAGLSGAYQKNGERGSKLGWGNRGPSYLSLFPALPKHIPVALVVGILEAQQAIITQPVVRSVKAQNAGLNSQSLRPLR